MVRTYTSPPISGRSSTIPPKSTRVLRRRIVRTPYPMRTSLRLMRCAPSSLRAAAYPHQSSSHSARRVTRKVICPQPTTRHASNAGNLSRSAHRGTHAHAQTQTKTQRTQRNATNLYNSNLLRVTSRQTTPMQTAQV